MSFNVQRAARSAMSYWLDVSPCQNGDTGNYDPDHEFMGDRFDIEDIDSRTEELFVSLVNEAIAKIGIETLDEDDVGSGDFGYALVILGYSGSGLAEYNYQHGDEMDDVLRELRIPDAFYYDVDGPNGPGEKFMVGGE